MTEATLTAPARSYASYAHPLWRRVLLTRETAVIIALILVAVVAYTQVPYFAQPITLTFLLLDIAPILLIALPMTLVIITG